VDAAVPGELLRRRADLGLAVVLTAAARWLERRLVVVALLAYLAFSVPHLVFHLGHLSGAGGPAGTVLAVLLTGSVVLPLALLVVVLWHRPAVVEWPHPARIPRGTALREPRH
jgi:hypothetical protein